LQRVHHSLEEQCQERWVLQAPERRVEPASDASVHHVDEPIWFPPIQLQDQPIGDQVLGDGIRLAVVIQIVGLGEVQEGPPVGELEKSDAEGEYDFIVDYGFPSFITMSSSIGKRRVVSSCIVEVPGKIGLVLRNMHDASLVVGVIVAVIRPHKKDLVQIPLVGEPGGGMESENCRGE